MGGPWATKPTVILWKLWEKHVRPPPATLPALQTFGGVALYVPHMCQSLWQQQTKCRFKYSICEGWDWSYPRKIQWNSVFALSVLKFGKLIIFESRKPKAKIRNDIEKPLKIRSGHKWKRIHISKVFSQSFGPRQTESKRTSCRSVKSLSLRLLIKLIYILLSVLTYVVPACR